MKHEEIRHKLSEYIDGSLPPQDRAAIEEHLMTCSACSIMRKNATKCMMPAASVSLNSTRRVVTNAVLIGTKREFRNPKRIPMYKKRNARNGQVRRFEHWNFVIRFRFAKWERVPL